MQEPPNPLTDAEYEALLDNIETMLEIGIAALDVAQYLFHADVQTVYPDEAIAAAQCRRDLQTLATSVERRREDGNSYAQPERIGELGDRLSK